MEQLRLNNGNGQSYGYIVYRKKLAIRQGATLAMRGRPRDLMLVNAPRLLFIITSDYILYCLLFPLTLSLTLAYTYVSHASLGHGKWREAKRPHFEHFRPGQIWILGITVRQIQISK